MVPFLKRMLARWWPAPEAERLLAAMEAAEIELRRHTPKDGPEGWWRSAEENLELARRHFEEAKYQVCWSQVKAAERAMLLDPDDAAGAMSKAVILLREAEDLGK